MAFTAEQLVTGANYSLASYQKKEPVDQVNIQHVTLDWLMKHKEASSFGNGTFKEPLFVDNGSNYQNYSGADQVTYNERDPVRWTDFTYYSNHDGFWFDEDRLIAAGIHLSDSADSVPTTAEKESLVNLLTQSYRGLKGGIQASMAMEMLRDGSQSAKACPGIASIVDPTPATGTVGGINAANFTYWRNNANLAFIAANVVTEMQESWDACVRFGGKRPTFIPVGQAFLDNYKAVANTVINRQIMNTNGGVTMDPSTGTVFFQGVPLQHDPDFEALDALLGTTTQTKTAYFLNADSLKLRPVKGEWMRDRKPERLPDRYVHYFAKTSKYGLTTDQRNALAVMSIA